MSSSYKDYIHPGRACGDCDACCVHMSIEDDGFEKPSDLLCQHRLAGGCAIYERRPGVCRSFHCVWRSMPALDESWRPDLSGMMIIWGAPPAGWRGRPAVEIVLLVPVDSVDIGRLAGLATGFIAKGVATSIDIPRGPSFAATRGFFNDLLGPSIARRDREQAETLLRAALAKMIAQVPQPAVG